MDPVKNPFSPGAGAPPPERVGREAILDQARVLLARIKAKAIRELIDAGHEVASLVRSQEGWRKVRPKIKSKWRVYSLAKDVVENSLPKL